MTSDITVNEAELFQTLRNVQVPCRSNPYSGVFTDPARLQAIDAELADSPFSNTFSGLSCNIYTKYHTRAFMDKDILLISSHVDTVENIQKLFAIQDDEKRLLSGTFDNTITNAACVYLMEHMDLPDSVVFAFTADEETGRCRGAGSALRYLLDNGADPNRLSVLSLDVTYEGFRKKCGFTLENLMNENVRSAFAEFANELEQPYVFASPNRNFPENVNKAYRSKSPSWFDEGMAYGKYGSSVGLRESVSLCMPVLSRPGHNDMHTNNGVLAWADGFLSYTKTLGAYAKDYLNERERLSEKLQEKFQPAELAARCEDEPER